MTKTEYLQLFDQYVERMRATTKAKNADYTGSGDDPFANFSSSEVIAGVSTLQGLLVRMGDKLARVKSFSQKGILEVKDETAEDTLLDLAIYSLLTAAYITSTKRPSYTVTSHQILGPSGQITLTPSVTWPHDLTSTSSQSANSRAP